MTLNEFIAYLEKRAYPYTLLENGRSQIAVLWKNYPVEVLLECVEIGIAQYFKYDEDGNLTNDSVEEFLEKLGGIAYNKTRNPIDSEIYHIKNICKSSFTYWKEPVADDLLYRYVYALKKELHISDNEIVADLQTNVKRISRSSRNWSEWRRTLEAWISEIQNED